MGIGRKLFIDDGGLDRYANHVYEDSLDDDNRNYADAIECRNYIMQQLKLASRLNTIQSISVLQSGIIRIRTRDLFISNSETGILRKFFVGKWKIECNYHFNLKFRSCDIQELGFHSGCWGDNTVHPHISGRSAEGCLGNAAAPLNLYIRNGDIKAFAIYAIGYLTSVNISDSAGRYLGGCKEVKLDEDGNVMHDEDGNYMFIKNEFNANNSKCVSTLFSTQVDTKHHEYITENSSTCKICGKPFNIDKIKPFRLNDTDRCFICDDCSNNIKTCDCCHSVITKDDKVFTTGDITLCSNCTDRYLTKCNMCDEFILPEGLTKENVKEVLIGNRTNVQFARKHTAYYSTARNGVKFSWAIAVCDKCIDIVKQNDAVKDNIVMFTKQNVDKNYVNILKDNIPYNKYKMRCSNCGTTPSNEVTNYIESMIVFNNRKCLDSRCYTSDRRNRDINDEAHEKTKNIYTHLLPYYKDGKLGIDIFDPTDVGIYGSNIVLPLDLFKDKDKWKIKDNDMKRLEYDDKDNTFVNISGHHSNRCYFCNKELADDEEKIEDKTGSIACKDCAENTYIHCRECGRLVNLTDQRMGICTDCSNTDTTLIIDDLNISAE